MQRSRVVRQLAAALRGVARRPVRSALAVTGVASTLGFLVVAVAMAERSRAATMEGIRRMGADILVVDAKDARNIAGRAAAEIEVRTLTDRDAAEIGQRVEGVSMVAAEFRGTLAVKAEALNRRVAVSGIAPAYGQLREAPLAAGRFFSSAEDAGGQRVAVVGASIARDLLGGRDVVGQTIRIGGISFSVIGVLPERGTGVDAFSEDEAIFVPLTTARRRLFNVDYVQRIFVRVSPGTSLDDAGMAITALLRDRHREPGRRSQPVTASEGSAGTLLSAGDESLQFRVQDQRRLVELREAAATRLRLFQLTVWVVLLVAGAGGVFALQLMAVRERRSEIGTRRAFGASRSDIFTHFTTEAWVVAGTGCALGCLGVVAWSRLSGVGIPAGVLGVAALSLLAVSMLAAAVPSWSAARLHPAVALRLV